MEERAAECGYRIVGVAHNNKPFIDNMRLLLQFPVDGYVFMYSSLTFEIAAFLRISRNTERVQRCLWRRGCRMRNR